MKIAIIADVHDNIYNLKKVLNLLKEEKIKKLICAGDLGNKETLKYLAENFKDIIYIVYGNADLYPEYEVKKYANLVFFKKFGFFKINELNFSLCHEPFYIKDILASNKKVDYIFYGHSHRPDMKIKNKIIITNPGALNDSLQISSFAIFDTSTKKIELKLC